MTVGGKMTDKAREFLKAHDAPKAGGIMTLAILVMAAVIALVTRLTESVRVDRLRSSVAQMLDGSAVSGDSRARAVGEQIEINGILDGSCCAFELDNGDAAVVMRVETIYGPMPCVYVVRPTDDAAAFVGALNASERVQWLLRERENTGGQQSIDYWARRIPSMIPYVEAEAGQTEDNGE